MTTRGAYQAPFHQVPSLEHWLVYYQKNMHRPFTKLVLILPESPNDQIPKYIDEALNNKSIFAIAGVNGTTSPHFLNAVVKFDDILENDYNTILFQGN